MTGKTLNTDTEVAADAERATEMTEPKITRERLLALLEAASYEAEHFIDTTQLRLAKERVAIFTLALQAEAMQPRQEQWTYGHCAEKQRPGGCRLHNLFCTYPDCDRRPAT